jgi:hypothetical protein
LETDGNDTKEVLKMELKDSITKSLLILGDEPDTGDIMQVINDVIKTVALQEPQYSEKDIRLIVKDMILNHEIPNIIIDMDDDEDDAETGLTEIKKYMTDSAYKKLLREIEITKNTIRKKLKENDTGTSDLPEDIKTEIKSIITTIVDTEKPEYINDVYGAITQKMLDSEILTKTNRSVIAAYVDELIKELGYDDGVESVGKTSVKTGEIETRSPYTDAVSSEKEINDSIIRHGKMLHEVYRKSSARFLE